MLMSTRTLFIGIGLGLVILMVVGAWLALAPAPRQEAPAPVTLPVVSSTTPRASGSDTQAAIEAALALPSTTRLGELDYLLTPQGSAIGKLEGTFQIAYHAPSRTFIISLLQEPLGQTRHEGEQYLLNLLHIGANEACARLHVNVAVPFDVNEQYAGRNLRMSFCPGATQLPE